MKIVLICIAIYVVYRILKPILSYLYLEAWRRIINEDLKKGMDLNDKDN